MRFKWTLRAYRKAPAYQYMLCDCKRTKYLQLTSMENIFLSLLFFGYGSQHGKMSYLFIFYRKTNTHSQKWPSSWILFFFFVPSRRKRFPFLSSDALSVREFGVNCLRVVCINGIKEKMKNIYAEGGKKKDNNWVAHAENEILLLIFFSCLLPENEKLFFSIWSWN